MVKSGVIIVSVIILIVIGFLAYFFMGGSNTPSVLPGLNDSNQNSQTQVNSVSISDFTFLPSVITIKKGDGVTWTNKDSAQHTIVSDSGSEISSTSLSKGGTYSHTFSSSGTFSYHCSVHPSMKGKVIVE
jgi:plastocyanin